MTIWEILKLSILIIGWPIFIIGSVFVFHKIHSTYKNIKRIEFGKLAAATLSGWIITMFSLGVMATAFMIFNPREGVIFTLPIFILWLITMVMLLKIVFNLTLKVKEISTIHEKLEIAKKEKEEQFKKISSLYKNLEIAIKEKEGQLKEISNLYKDLETTTKEKEEQFKELEKLNKFMIGREIRMTELKKRINELEKR